MRNTKKGGILIGVLILLITFVTLGTGYLLTTTRYYINQKKTVNSLQYTYMPNGENSKYDAYDYTYNKLLNAPVLDANGKMTPLKYNTTTNAWVTAQANNSDGWYEYGRAKKWANAKLPDGSMYVWIPRYVYKITYTNAGDYSQGGTISIKFSKGTTDDTTPGYTLPSAFNFGGTQLQGIWVAKFEASNNGGNAQSLPGLASYTGLTIAGTSAADTTNAFYKCTQIKTTYSMGANTNTHLIKNSEWGAAVYLAKAIGVEPAKNTTTTTGGNATALTVYTTNVAQSTTGNAYGIYDMNGGSPEFVASYLNTFTTNLYLIVNNVNKANYADIIDPSVTPATATANYSYIVSTRNGMAINETSTTGNVNNKSWGASEAMYPYNTYPVFLRGGSTSNNSSMYAFNFSNGASGPTAAAFRSSIIVY